MSKTGVLRAVGEWLMWSVIACAVFGWGCYIGYNQFVEYKHNAKSQCSLVNGQWAEERGMCFVPATTLNGLNP